MYIYGQANPHIRTRTTARTHTRAELIVKQPKFATTNSVMIDTSLQTLVLRSCVRACAFVCMCVCVCMHVFMCVFMHVCMYTYACVYVCIHMCLYVCMFVCMHVCLYVCMHVCMSVCMHVCTAACVHACMRVYTKCMCVCASRFSQMCAVVWCTREAGLAELSYGKLCAGVCRLIYESRVVLFSFVEASEHHTTGLAELSSLEAINDIIILKAMQETPFCIPNLSHIKLLHVLNLEYKASVEENHLL